MHDLLDKADQIVLACSGGKDSTAAALLLIEQGYSPKLELWHNLVDGNGPNFMDWQITEDYCRRFAQAIGVPIYFSYRVGGFEAELCRNNQPTAAVRYELPNGSFEESGGKGNPNTREKFPAISNELAIRWCSLYLKITCMAAGIRNQPRFNNSHTVVITGERALESSKRASYKMVQVHPTDASLHKLKRKVTHLRLILDYDEMQVWDVLRRNRIQPHPSYMIGFGRASCKLCIFLNPNALATIAKIDPQSLERIARYEQQFDHTIAHNRMSVIERAKLGTPYDYDPLWAKRATSYKCDFPIILPRSQKWELPLGAGKDLTIGSP